ncbi:hypothetical protein Tco_0801796 [Tanacetum coccineum]|uniref:Uncharacterized protein n=1 Tax=Tanacetum coccineum TaxID=301880 RepID=A0ABQ4ZX74_9ASTR
MKFSLSLNQVDARVQNFKINFLKEAVRDFQSLAKEADKSLAKHKELEWEIERLLRGVENEYAKLWNDWYKKCEECKYDKILYDKVYNDMQQKIERLQAHLGDQKGKSKDTLYVSDTLDPLPQKLKNENVELEFQVRNYEKENAHLKTAYKNLFDTINVLRAQTKLIIDSLQNKLHDTIYENAKLRAQLFDKVFEQKDTTKGTSTNTKFANQSTKRKPFLQSLRNTLVVKQPNAFQSERSNFSKTQVPQKVDKTNDLSNPVTSSNSYGVSIVLDKEGHILGDTKNEKRSTFLHLECRIKNKKLKQTVLITANHDVCVLNYVNGMNSRGSKERLASPKPSEPRMRLRWSPTGRIFYLCRKLIRSSDSECYPDMSMVRRLGFFQAYDRESKASHQFRLEVFGNRSLWK